MTQALGQFVKTTASAFSDGYAARDAADGERPLLVWVNEFKTGLKTKHAPNGDGEGVIVDLIDLAQFATDPMNSVFCNVLWMGGAVRDQLKGYAGSEQPFPIKLVWQSPQGGGMRYVQPEALDGQWLEYASSVYSQYPTFVKDRKAQKKAEWEAANPQQVPAVPTAIPGMQGLSGPAPVAQVVPPAVQQAPVQAAPVAAPPVTQVSAPVAAPVLQAPGQPPMVPAAAPPVPVMSAPVAPAQAPAMVAPAAAPAAVTDMDVNAMLEKLNQQ